MWIRKAMIKITNLLYYLKGVSRKINGMGRLAHKVIMVAFSCQPEVDDATVIIL